MLFRTLFFIILARSPKRKDDRVSVESLIAGDTDMMRESFEVPPRESSKMRVSLLFLKGMCTALVTRDVNAAMTSPSADSDLFMIFASTRY
jgi:hypothetical protein